MYKTGAVIGKFYPFHLGHKLLIDTAMNQTENLYILVNWNRKETIPPETRYQWLKTAYPFANVMLVEDEDYDQNDSKLWAELTLKWLGFKPEAVFTSEDYGDTWAKYLKTKHVAVDKSRVTVPVSGTKIRENPYMYWQYMLPMVRAYFVKRVCIVGSESTGKTTLSKGLAEHYKTPWVPEYGRLHWEARLTGGDNFKWGEKDFIKIAEEQNILEDELAKEANKVLICDTDAFATAIWFERYMGYRSKIIDSLANPKKYDLYLLSDPSVPFEDDGTRDGEKIRDWMHERFVTELKRANVPYFQLSGSKEENLKQAIKQIDKLFPASH